MRKNIVFDFDGVIHSYKTGWNGEPDFMPDPPVEGIKEAISELREAGYFIAVVSTRCITDLGLNAVKEYLHKWDITVDGVFREKIPAYVYVDDRAITFDGDTKGLIDRIKGFKSWLEAEKEGIG